ncbi:hypothetical protein Vretimale_4853 [Volvox reticuliferus]|uniref:CobW C-terminal domain-containing protein n=1 Tax=Volvox reticuliferus TaxID=1737510 RepID=A0A8J4C0V4_9CHLO|nr:hypothetical protein Vretifemale_3476 [Volvox reticuliferus]GIL99710.1 hypothetical protein Vretimale_4853 [Volvox reticuliferus]
MRGPLGTMSTEVHQVNLFARYEQRLFSGDTTKPKVIPAVVITGFLGSGKTTLVQHILRNRGSLRIAVLVNEVGQLDVDSKLLNAKQGNAALGLPAVDLSGGCVCCARAEDLTAALRELRVPPAAAASGPSSSSSSFCQSSSAPCDYLLVETSGAADAGPLAEALMAAGYRLDAVVAVVDAEAGRQALEHPVAHAQISCADVVVLNKCDLVAPGLSLGFGGSGVGLGALADMEDMLAEMAPGIRVVRARYGEVPLTAILDVEPVGTREGDDGGELPAADVATTAGDGGGFMSHESMPSGRGGTGAGGYRLASGLCTADGMAVGSSRHTKRRTQAGLATTVTLPQGIEPHRHSHGHHNHNHPGTPGQPVLIPLPIDALDDSVASATSQAAASAGGAPHSYNHDQVYGAHGHGDHARLHSGFYTESLTVADRPCSLVMFADYAVGRLVKEPALLRSKGVLWFGERRGHRFTFHLSGRRRLEVAQEGPWEGPPASHLVLIGTDAAAMRRLRDAFLTEVASVVPTLKPMWALGGGSGDRATSLSGGVGDGIGGALDDQAVSELEAAAACISAQERLELLGCERWEFSEAPGLEGGSTKVTEGGPSAPAVPEQLVEAGGRPDVRGGGGGGLLSFTTRGSALHGINSEELNAELLRRVNASGTLLLVAVTAPGRISAVTNVQARDRVVSLLFACTACGAQEQAGLCVKTFAEPLLRKAYAHVLSCKCDIACGPTVVHVDL